MTLTEFLLARIAEDEAVARQTIDTRDRIEYVYGPPGVDFGIFVGADDAVPMVHVGPERVLAECEAKRRIVALHHPLDGGAPENYPYVSVDGRTVWPGCAVCDEGSPSRPHCATIRLLAAVYADHPDCREEWKP